MLINKQVEKLHEYLWDLISQSHNNGVDSHEGKTTRGSSGFCSSNQNGNDPKSKNNLNI